MWYHAERQQKTVSQCSSGRLTRSASMSRSCAFLIQRRSLGSGSLDEAYIYTPFMKKVLHITKRKRKSNIHHYCKSDDFRAGFEVVEWRMFCHSAWLQISPARFKQVYSDSANGCRFGREVARSLPVQVPAFRCPPAKQRFSDAEGQSRSGL